MKRVAPLLSPTSRKLSNSTLPSLLITLIGQSPTPKDKITYPKLNFLINVKIRVVCRSLSAISSLSAYLDNESWSSLTFL